MNSLIKMGTVGLSAGMLISCFTRIREPFRYDNSNIRVLERSIKDFHSPDEIMSLLGRSSLKFEIVESEENIEHNIAEGPAKPPEINPYFNTKSRGKQRRLFVDRPAEEIKSLWNRAEEYAYKKDYGNMVSYYEKALKIDPTYFKNYTEFGKGLLMLEKADEAILKLQRAIELNDIDYEAHFMLSKAFLRKKKLDRARKSLIVAYMLNKYSPEILGQLDYVLKGTGYYLRKNRFDFGFRVEKKSDSLVNIVYSGEKGKLCIALATCLAAWDHTENYRETMLRGMVDTLDLIKNKECLMSQTVGLEGLLKQDSTYALPLQLKLLYVSIIDNALDAMVLWEFGVARDPYSILLADYRQKEKIIQYIERYVIINKSLKL